MAGLFLVFEGIDGAGTTTQSRLMFEALGVDQTPAHLTQEPSEGPVGVIVRQVLSGRLVVAGLTGHRAPGWATMALLFAADRLDHLDSEILPNLADGITVISDRYVYSSLLYQTETSGSFENLGWVEQINRLAPRPDLTIVLDVPAALAARRRESRRDPQQIYEEADLQARLAARYRDLPIRYPSDRIQVVDGTGKPEDVHRVCWDLVQQARRRR
jgi:dTMP kinase